MQTLNSRRLALEEHFFRNPDKDKNHFWLVSTVTPEPETCLLQQLTSSNFQKNDSKKELAVFIEKLCQATVPCHDRSACIA